MVVVDSGHLYSNVRHELSGDDDVAAGAVEVRATTRARQIHLYTQPE
jgi:hypothetical protein